MRFYRKDVDDYSSGPEFLLFASRLYRYQGAVRGVFEDEAREMQEAYQQDYPSTAYEPSPYSSGQSMSMAEALSNIGQNNAALEALNRESVLSASGPLFEIETA
jgi:hypothetical protein